MLIQKYAVVVNGNPFRIFTDREEARKIVHNFGTDPNDASKYLAKIDPYYGSPYNNEILDYVVNRKKKIRKRQEAKKDDLRCSPDDLAELVVAKKNYEKERKERYQLEKRKKMENQSSSFWSFLFG